MNKNKNKKIFFKLLLGLLVFNSIAPQRVFAASAGVWKEVGLMNMGMDHYAVSVCDSLAIDKNGIPYVAFVDNSGDSGGNFYKKVISKKFDGTPTFNK